MKKSVSILPVMALSAAFLAACSDDSSSSNPDATDPGLSSSSIDMQAPTSSDITPTESSSSEVPEYVDPASLVPDEKGFVDIQLVYRSLQPNEKAVFAIRHAERDPSVTRESPLSEDGEEQALEVGRKLVGPDEFTYTHTDFVRTYKTCLNIATGRGQATFPNDTNDIFTESWFISNDSLYKEYSSQQNNSRVVIASWSYNGEFADAFYDYNEKNAEMVKMLAGDYATASRVRIVCSHDNFLVPLAVYLTNKAVDIKLFERNVWLNYLAGVAIITNDAGAQRFYAVKGLNSGVR